MKDIYIVVGPTSSGKSDYAVKLAKEIGGEVISADSRQIYKELNLLSGKITRTEMGGIPHHMLSVASIKNDYSAEIFASEAKKIILDILKRNKKPIICGGTGFYIEALINKLNNTSLPKVEPNKKFRASLEKISTEELFKILKAKDPRRAENIDSKNRIRLIRALEIVEALGQVPQTVIIKNKYNLHWVGLDFDNEKLQARILKRLKNRIDEGMLDEAQKVYKLIGGTKMKELGLECKYCALYIEKSLNKKDLIKELSIKIWQYAKRQRTWFKRNSSIQWVVR